MPARDRVVALASAVLLAGALAGGVASGCSGADDGTDGATGSGRGAGSTPAPPPPALDLPGGELVVDVPEGGEYAPPGAEGVVELSVGAIERGTARVTLARVGGSTWVKLRPMAPGDLIDFDFGGQDYRVTLTELVIGGEAPAARFRFTSRDG